MGGGGKSPPGRREAKPANSDEWWRTFPGRASAPIKDGKYAPLPAGLDKEWIDYIKQGKVPPLMGAAALVYPPPNFTEIGVFRGGQVKDDQMMSGVYECWFDATDQEQVTQALIFMRKLNNVYLNFLRERAPGFEKAYIVIESPYNPAEKVEELWGNMYLPKMTCCREQAFRMSLPGVVTGGRMRVAEPGSGATVDYYDYQTLQCSVPLPGT